ncbi:hypothetical protein E3N88_11276 [Mikania micrantha]|uniref:Uncharacterized protein n=1 Tax=Mikania micrantha TaxID=192012 RepID=A0A5N6PD21_9ASTR|nr:hypothetical protein E3N88_11276 [Mikania micrantha]
MAVCGVNHHLYRRTAERGNDRVLFSSQGCKFQETNPEAFIGDENHGKEEYLEGCSGIYPSPPCFDDYGDEELSKNDYLWVTKVLNEGVTQGSEPLVLSRFTRCANERITCLNGKYLNQEVTEYADTPARIFNEFANESQMADDSNQVATEAVTWVKGGGYLTRIIQGMATPSKEPTITMGVLNIPLMNINFFDNLYLNTEFNIHGNTNLEFEIILLMMTKCSFKINFSGPISLKYRVVKERVFVKIICGRRSNGFDFKLRTKFFFVFTVIEKHKLRIINKGTNGFIKFLKRLNSNVHKTRGRVFFEDGENDAGEDPRNNPDPEWDPD